MDDIQKKYNILLNYCSFQMKTIYPYNNFLQTDTNTRLRTSQQNCYCRSFREYCDGLFPIALTMYI